jgi:hypothetical protein
MRNTLLASAALLGMAMSLPAFAQTATDPGPANPPAVQDGTPASNASDQGSTGNMPAHPRHHRMRRSAAAGDDSSAGQWAHQPGTGESGPASSQASNIDGDDTHSAIAPHLPRPMVGENAGPDGYLKAADRALAAHQTGAAQQALEMAETRLLDRSTAPDAASQPDQSPRIAAVAAARKDLAAKNWAGARRAIQEAMGGGEDAMQGQSSQMGAMTAPAGAGPGQMQTGQPQTGQMPTGQMPTGMTTNSTTTDTSNVSVMAPDTGHNASDGHPGVNPAPLAGTNGGSMGAAGVNNPGAPYAPNPANPGNEAK